MSLADLRPDLEQARRFIAELTGASDAPITFQTFHDSLKPAHGRVFHGTLGDHAETLAELNRAGHGVFMMINAGDLDGRSAENVRALRALFIDEDGLPEPPSFVACPPSIIVRSKAGRHCYWLLHPGEALDSFRPAQASLAAHFGTDPKVKDLCRVMRLPGFWHLKDPAAPFMVEPVSTSSDRYTIAEVLAAYPAPAPEVESVPRAAVFSGPVTDRVEQARRYVARVPPAIEGNGGDEHTLNLAAKLVRGFDLTDAEALGVLVEWNTTCQPPWTEAELLAKIGNARRYGSEPIGGRLRERAPAREEPPPPSDADCPPALRAPEPGSNDDDLTPTRLPAGWTQGTVDGQPVGLPYPTREAPKRETARRLSVVPASDVEPETVEWLWEGYLARGKVHLLDGDPGSAKTTGAIGLGACLTRGRALPYGPKVREPMAVLFSSLEDGLGDTLVPRARAADADLSKFYFIDLRDPASGATAFPRDLAELEQIIAEKGIALFVADPLMAHLSGDVDSHRDQDVRRALAPLCAMAERTRCAVVVIRHLNKAAGASAIYRGGGSIGITGAARIVLLAAKDPDRPGSFVLAGVKSNLGPLPKSLSYTIGTSDGAAVVLWGEACDRTADELLAIRAQPGDAPALREAEDFLKATLAAGPKQQAEVEREARDLGISLKTLKRAKKTLADSSKRGFESAWYWSLKPLAPFEEGQGGLAPFVDAEEGHSRRTLAPFGISPPEGRSNNTERKRDSGSLEEGQAGWPPSKRANDGPLRRIAEEGQAHGVGPLRADEVLL